MWGGGECWGVGVLEVLTWPAVYMGRWAGGRSGKEVNEDAVYNIMYICTLCFSTSLRVNVVNLDSPEFFEQLLDFNFSIFLFGFARIWRVWI